MNALSWLATLSLTVALVWVYRAAWQRARARRDAAVTFDATFRVPSYLHGEGEDGSLSASRVEAPFSFSDVSASDAPTTLDVAVAVRRELAGRGYPSATVRVVNRKPKAFVAEVSGVPLVTLRSAEADIEERLPPDVDCELRVGLASH